MKKAFAIAVGNVASERGQQLRSAKWMILNRDRSLPHFGRKLYHMLMGCVCFVLYAFVLDRTQALWALSVIGGIFVVFDLFRLRVPSVNNFVVTVYGGLMRREELRSVSGNSFYVLGLFVLALAFPKPIALLAILYLAFGDPVAAIAGTLFGKHRIVGKKSLEGAAANFLVCAMVTAILALSYFGLSLDRAALLALVGGCVAVVSELLPLPIDDNFTLPVVSAILLSALSLVIPLF